MDNFYIYLDRRHRGIGTQKNVVKGKEVEVEVEEVEERVVVCVCVCVCVLSVCEGGWVLWVGALPQLGWGF